MQDRENENELSKNRKPNKKIASKEAKKDEVEQVKQEEKHIPEVVELSKGKLQKQAPASNGLFNFFQKGVPELIPKVIEI